MNRLKQYPVFSALLITLLLAAGAEGWCLWERFHAAHAAQARLEQKRAQIHEIAATTPAPTREIAAAVEADLARTQRALATMQAALKGNGPAAGKFFATPPPAQRPQAWQDIATFVEASRQRAQKYGVILKPDERFGLADYATEGPDGELIPVVFHERLVIQYLVEALFDARPRQLLSVQREHPLTKREREARAAALAAALATGAPAPEPDVPAPVGDEAGAAPDTFEIDPRISARVPGFVDATAFRLSFTGQSASLRVLLNKLGQFELPLVVRAVEVAPAPMPPAAEESRAPGAKVSAPPLIPRPLSRFTVTVEFIEPAATPAAPPAT